MHRAAPAIRLLRVADLDGVVAVDRLLSHNDRRDYYARKIERVAGNPDNINCSLVAELDGGIVGFVMGNVYYGEFGIPETSAVIDTIGVAPEYQGRGIAGALMRQFLANMRGIGARNVCTLVNWDHAKLKQFFARYHLEPSRRRSLELRLA
jgi:predicted N-acetyltransferase YhbS